MSSAEPTRDPAGNRTEARPIGAPPGVPASAGSCAQPGSERAARTRLWALLIFSGCAAVLGVAACLTPDPRGFGTHQLFRTGPCGMLVMTGYPCPTCGMTTAFAHTVRGQWLRAFLAQPAGFVLALATIAGVLVSAGTLIRGRWPRVNLWFITPYRLFLALLILLFGGWAFKIVVGLATKQFPYR